MAKLLLAHRTQREIAEIMGCSMPTITKDVKAIRQQWKDHYLEAQQEYTSVELQKLLELESAMWGQAMEGKGYAVERILQVMDHRAKLLGLYAPAQSRLSVITEEVLDDAISTYTARLEQLTIEAGSSEPGEIEEVSGA